MKYKVTITGANFIDKYILWAWKSRKIMKIIAELIRYSIDQNFKMGGRPEKWPQLHPITLALRRKLGRGSKPLMDTGQLRLQMVQRVTKTSVEHKAMVPYAGVHQQDGKWGSFITITAGKRALLLRGHGGARKKSSRKEEKFFVSTVRIPARPFMLLQKQDIEAIKKIIKSNFLGGPEVTITEQ